MLSVANDGVLLKVYGWFKERQEAVFEDREWRGTEEWWALRRGDTHIKPCPIIRMVVVWGPFLILPSWIGRFVLFPFGGAALFLGFVCVALPFAAVSGYQQLAPEASGFDIIAALKVAGMGIAMIVVGVPLGLAAMVTIFAAVIAVCWGIWKACKALFSYLPKFPRIRFRLPDSFAIIGEFLKGIDDRICPLVHVRPA